MLAPLTRLLGSLLDTDELSGRGHDEPRVRVITIIVFKPPAKPSDQGAGVERRIEAPIVAIEASHEDLRHAVGFGTCDCCEARKKVLREAKGGHRRSMGYFVLFRKRPFKRNSEERES